MHVVIVGGGFGGVKAALDLARDPKIRVSLISDEPYFLYHATLYSVATGRNSGESVVSLGHIFARHPNVTVIHDRIISLDHQQKIIRGKKEYRYDELILALGVVTSFFGIKGMGQHAYGIKTLEQVERFKQHIYDEVVRDQHLDKNYVVVGAGPTGVEFAGALNTYLRELVTREHIRNAAVRVTLVEAAPRILPHFSDTASRKVAARLKKNGVKVMVNTKVEGLADDLVLIDRRSISSHTVVWMSGVAQNPFFKDHEDVFKLGPTSRVIVSEQLEASAHIYVIGDSASTRYSGLATSALTDGAFIARVLKAKLHKHTLPIYRPVRFPDSVPVDQSWAYVESHSIYAAGRLGAFARRMLELQVLSSLIGLKMALPVWRARDLRDDGYLLQAESK